jgi:DNA-binding GntR family transcriptional regulator
LVQQNRSNPSRTRIERVQSLQEQTYQALRTAILSGEFVGGDRLVESQLAEWLQVSRTPVREALRQLQHDALITADGQGGLSVAQLSAADAGHLYDCRLGLEKIAVAGACQHIRSPQLKQLKKAVERAENSWGKPSHNLTSFQLLHMDYEFHRLLAESSGNPWLLSLLDQVFSKMALMRIRTLQHNPQVLEIRGEHRRIYEAVADRDAIIAMKFIHDHLEASRLRVIQEIQALRS